MAEQVKDSSQDPSHPLFLHHSDGPGLILTSQPTRTTPHGAAQ